jgi:YVTN family beta-propeller protein
MKLRISGLLAIAAFLVAGLLGAAQSLAQNAYITNASSDTVSVIDTTTNAVSATIPVGFFPVGGEPFGVAVSPDGREVYLTNNGSSGIVSVIDATTNTVKATIPVGSFPVGVAVARTAARSTSQIRAPPPCR